MSLAEMFNPDPNSVGYTLYEHYEQDSEGRPYLLYVSSTPPVTIDPGDVVIQRTWAPASAPHIYSGAAGVVGQEGKNHG